LPSQCVAIPKFTAEFSLRSGFKQVHSQNLLPPPEHKGQIMPAAPYWGDFRREECVSGGISGRRKYSAVLWGSDNWEYDCRRTPAYIRNEQGIVRRYYANYCDKQLFNMWGVFYVPESSCDTIGFIQQS
jgi:hypothetical protein